MAARANEAQPFYRIAPRALGPVVLTCEHASRRLPPAAGAATSPQLRSLLSSHWGWDIGAFALTRALAERLGATAIGGRWSRLWIDLNRRADDPTLIRREAGAQPIPWNRSLDPAAVERRVLEVHTPYHQELDRLILRHLLRGVRPLLFAVHSFTPLLDGRSRPFEIGLLYEEHAGLARGLGRQLKRDGFSLRYNQPYSGLAGMMYCVDRHGSHHGLPFLELEVNQELFGDRRRAGRLAASVARGLRALVC